MNGGSRLTWYPGSVLPYASLWHTLQRVIALNRLGMGELPRHPHARLRRFTIHPKHNLLFNEPDPIDTAALAAWLGEPAQALHWSHMGAVAPWLRPLFTPGMRVCCACLGAGYHSALLSLRLLPACPIHGVALRSQCQCGRPFTAALNGQSCHCAGGCPCGRLTFFTRQTCRRPTLDAAVTTAFDPVVAWLQQCSAVITWRPQAQAGQGGDSAMWMDSLAQWSTALGIEYPAVFEQPRVRGQYQVSVHRSHGAAAPAVQQPQPDREPQARVSPACAVYQAMARHLRRHVMRRGDAWMAKFMQSAHPLHIARMLAGRRYAVLSLAEALWARQAEAGVEQRRWPYRPAAALLLLPLQDRLLCDGLALDHQAQPLPLQQQLDARRRQWLEYHAAGTMLATLWGHALSRAVMACRTGLADWQPNCCGLPQLCGCAAVVEPDGSLRFVSIRACGTAVRMPPLPDKAQRRHAAGVAPLQALCSACHGPCLTWTGNDGWHVAESRAPCDSAFKRHRLLGIAAVRPHFWVFRCTDAIVARHCSVAMQALGATPGQAIEALRAGVRQHARLYGTQAHRPRLGAMAVDPQPCDGEALRTLHVCIDRARDLAGFWAAARLANSLTRQYLDAAAQRMH